MDRGSEGSSESKSDSKLVNESIGSPEQGGSERKRAI